jgi:L-ribulose-5-phosphate 4-epimerase
MKGYRELKERVWLCNCELPRRNLVTYTFGNASGIDRTRGVFAIKPSGVPYEILKPKDMIVVDLENRVVDGALRYSSDTKTHSFLYRHFPEIGGVVHTHAVFSVAWAQAIRNIPLLGTTHADHLSSDIPCTAVMSDEMIQGDYEEETGRQILECFRNISYRDVQMVLVACHGPFTWGETPEKAVYHSVVLEELAKMALYTELLNKNVPRLKDTLVQKHYNRKHGIDAYYGQN